MKIVYKLYEIRAQKGMSLRKLEELSGIGKSTINRIENGEANPTVEIICQLVLLLAVNPVICSKLSSYVPHMGHLHYINK
ncbi:MAG: helix-turn-helix domain-containing protein [Eubacterium sp.]|nr:helix-turn-helix domain-containing protein [Eubacterium sp.]